MRGTVRGGLRPVALLNVVTPPLKTEDPPRLDDRFKPGGVGQPILRKLALGVALFPLPHASLPYQILG